MLRSLVSKMKSYARHVFFAALWLALYNENMRADFGEKATARIARGGSGLGRNAPPAPSWLGVGIAEVPAEIGTRLPIESGTGLVVDQVIANSPAEIAGLQRGDVLARLNTQTLVTVTQLQKLVMHRKAGEQVEITFFRKGEKRKVVAVLQPRGRM